MRRIVVFSVALGLLSPFPALAGQIRERTTFFMVKGKTFDELNRELGKKGPDIGQGARHAGSTQVSFTGNVTYKNKPGGCGIDRARFQLDLHTTLPRWSAPRGADADTKLLWKILHDDIVTHEAEHANLAKDWLKRIERTIGALPAERTCPQMEKKVNALTRRLLKEHETAQLAFDARESRQIDARLQRKLDEHQRRIATR